MTMKDRRKIISWLLLIVIAPLAGWFWYDRLRTPTWDFVYPGTRITGADLDFLRPEIRERLVSTGFLISSSTLVVVPPKPGVVFSTVRKPGCDEEFAYLILFKYGGRIWSSGSGRGVICTFDGTVAKTSPSFYLNDKEIEMSYCIELNETHTSVANERLTIEGNYVDMRSGRVFLVDLTAEPTVYRQMKVEPPAVPSKLETREDAEQAAEAIRKSLESQVPEIKAFCRSRSARLVTNLERTLILSNSRGDEIVNPSDKQIREALSALDVGRDGEGCVVLARSEMSYVHVSGDKTSGFDMEYQEGDLDHHYLAVREDFQLEEVVEAFANFRDGRIDWSVYGDWNRISR